MGQEQNEKAMELIQKYNLETNAKPMALFAELSLEMSSSIHFNEDKKLQKSFKEYTAINSELSQHRNSGVRIKDFESRLAAIERGIKIHISSTLQYL
ncbi:hypothetical protein JHS3_03010 [Jeongeupia sp. HS-3]|nr:hypothetical protein JHS3_03010 [Jeongeupia sp. HS-3]